MITGSLHPDVPQLHGSAGEQRHALQRVSLGPWPIERQHQRPLDPRVADAANGSASLEEQKNNNKKREGEGEG